MDHTPKSNLEAVRMAIEKISKALRSPADRRPLQQELERELNELKVFLEDHKNLINVSLKVREEYENLCGMYLELLAVYNALTQAPHAYARFVRVLAPIQIIIDEKGTTKEFPTIEVTDDHGIYSRRVLANDEIKPEDLQRGERLTAICNGNIIGRTGEFDLTGEEAEVEQDLGEDREGTAVLVKSKDHGEARIAHISAGFSGELRPGQRVLITPRTNLIVGALPDKESKKYVIPQIPKETFDDVRGLGSVILKIQKDMIWPIVRPDLYARFGKPRFKGYVLHGPPGCGKTMLTKALANEMALLLSEKYGVDIKGNFFYIGGTELLDKWVGNTEGFMRDIFATAESVSKKTDPPSPAIITFDDAEVMFRTRGSGISSDVNESHVTQICTLLQGMEERGNVIVIFLTNRIEMMDPAVARHGRVSKTIYIPRPDREGVKSIFLKYLKADWKVLHPKYHVDVYSPQQEGRPIFDKSGKIWRVQFANDPRRVVEYLAERAVDRLFGETHETQNEVLRVSYEGDKEPTILRYGDFISGSSIAEGIMPEVLQMAITEAVEQEKKGEGVATGVQMKFIYEAIEIVFEEMRQTIKVRSPQSLAEWLAIQGHHSKPIFRISFPPSMSIGDKKGVKGELTEEEL